MDQIATLNVTHAGFSVNIPEPIPMDLADEDVRRTAAECLEIPVTEFRRFVIDRFPDTGMVYLRPKVPFG